MMSMELDPPFTSGPATDSGYRLALTPTGDELVSGVDDEAPTLRMTDVERDTLLRQAGDDRGTRETLRCAAPSVEEPPSRPVSVRVVDSSPWPV